MINLKIDDNISIAVNDTILAINVNALEMANKNLERDIIIALANRVNDMVTKQDDSKDTITRLTKANDILGERISDLEGSHRPFSNQQAGDPFAFMKGPSVELNLKSKNAQNCMDLRNALNLLGIEEYEITNGSERIFLDVILDDKGGQAIYDMITNHEQNTYSKELKKYRKTLRKIDKALDGVDFY